MFERVLIANRGEIAVRIAKTLRKMGIESVVVASIPDRRSLAVRTADDWVLLEGYSAAESYLDADAVITAAKAKGCQAIHPGYGFLAERADFAERCAAEGIVFIGPTPDILRSVGDKSSARQLAVANGVPVVPGWDGEDDAETLGREAERIGYPVMLKARGGGGGRGMREVFAPGELADAIESARREALAAFGDGGLLLEKLVTEAHHVEVQVLGDSHGNVIHLGERDCSVQRRHQKLIEESPSPVVDDALRSELTGAALKLARAVNYVNAGTFEFLVGAPGADWRRPFYFLEVNPRLQVEHPVTEMVTGLDIVELQLRIAAGEPLPMRQEDVRFEGHAIEFRVNAEDPWDGFRPSSGRIESIVSLIAWDWDREDRLDTGYEDGDSVPTQYDSLLMKRIVHEDDRMAAVTAGTRAGSELAAGVATNGALLQRIAGHADFAAGRCHTGWLERVLDQLLERPSIGPEWWAAAAWGLAIMRYSAPSRINASMFARSIRWHGAGPRTMTLRAGNETVEVGIRRESHSKGAAIVGGQRISCRTVQRQHDDESALVVAGEMRLSISQGYGAINEISISLEDDGPEHRSELIFRAVPPSPLPRRAAAASAGATAITAPLSGTIAAVRVAEGDVVEAGQALVMLEAMKMEHRIVATADGTVRSVLVKAGDVVREGDVLLEVG